LVYCRKSHADNARNEQHQEHITTSLTFRDPCIVRTISHIYLINILTTLADSQQN